MEISIIIPIYNAEKYLSRCLDSVLNAINDFNGKAEILLIDNNSTDNSSAIIEKYKKKCPNIISSHKQSVPGAAATRNYGLKKAEGKYVWFVDADDTIRDDAVIKLLETARKSSADLVMLGMRRLFPDGHSDYLSAVCPSQKNYKSRFVRYGLGPVQVLIRKSWWQEHGFKFREGIIHEDMELMSALILYTDKFTCVDEPLYNYFQNPESVLHKSSWDPHYFDIFSALAGLYARFDENGAIREYHSELEWFFIWNLLIDSAKDFSKFREGRSGFRRSRKILKQYFPNWQRNVFLKQKPAKLKLRVLYNYYRCK